MEWGGFGQVRPPGSSPGPAHRPGHREQVLPWGGAGSGRLTWRGSGRSGRCPGAEGRRGVQAEPWSPGRSSQRQTQAVPPSGSVGDGDGLGRPPGNVSTRAGVGGRRWGLRVPAGRRCLLLQVLDTYMFHSFLKARLSRRMDAFAQMDLSTQSEEDRCLHRCPRALGSRGRTCPWFCLHRSTMGCHKALFSSADELGDSSSPLFVWGHSEPHAGTASACVQAAPPHSREALPETLQRICPRGDETQSSQFSTRVQGLDATRERALLSGHFCP